MSNPEVPCSCCGGKGHRKLSKKLAESHRHALALLDGQESFSVSDLAKRLDCETTAAHHRIKRMVAMGVMKRYKKVTPARFVVA